MKTIRTASKSLEEITLLRRYQRRLLFGGGILLSLAVIAGICLAIWVNVQGYLAEEHVLYVSRKVQLAQEMDAPQIALQPSVVYLEAILAARGNVVVFYLLGALLLLTLLWGLIFFYLKNIINPVLLRSQYVFDSEQLNRALITMVPNGLCLISLDSGKLLLQNKATHFYDNSDEPIYRRLLQLRLRPRPDISSPDAEDSAVAEQEMTVYTSDRQSIFLLVTFVDIEYFGERLVLCSLLDITDRKQAERRMREARVAAEAANQAKSAFLAAMSHEIRTPLHGILGNLELLSYTQLSELQQERLQTITNASQGLLEIINDVLDISKIETGQMRVENISFDVVELVEQALLIFLTLADQKGLAIYYRISPKLPRWLLGDPMRLRQIVMNLLSNAIKFTERGNITLSCDIEQQNNADAPVLVLRVVDTGIGISGGRQAQLFKAFEQGDASVARQFGGSGLGLSLCQSLAELMNGTITVVSEVGVGSEFVVVLPLLKAAMPAASFAKMPRGKINVLCPMQEWRRHVVEQLQDWGLTVRLLQHTGQWNSNDGPLLFYGQENSSRDGLLTEFSVIDAAIICAYPSGPRHPTVQQGSISISCYSLDGLHQSLLSVLMGDRNFISRKAVHDPMLLGAPPEIASEFVRVLVVEDHLVSRELIGEQLVLLGYRVSLASNVGQALQLYAGNQFDIVFTDLSMPGTDGFMLARMLREQRCELPIIAITAHASQEEIIRCRDVGINDVMLKPTSMREMARIVRQHLIVERNFQPRKIVECTCLPQTELMLQALRDSSLDSLQQIREARAEQHCALMLQKLHAIKGAFAMQKQVQVVNACQAMEVACKDKIPSNFDDRFEELEDLVLRTISKIEQASF